MRFRNIHPMDDSKASQRIMPTDGIIAIKMLGPKKNNFLSNSLEYS